MTILAALLACTPPVPETPPDPVSTSTSIPTEPAGPPVARWAPLDTAEVAPLWGAMGVGTLSVGGVDPALDVVTDVLEVGVDGEALVAEAVGTLGEARFCGCAMEDPGREELVVIGGRDAAYRDTATAERLDLTTGESIPIDGMGAADNPVGCWAAFSPEHDLGWVFGGGGGMSLSGETWRYDPEAETFERLDIEGPPARYDAAFVPLPDGGLLLVGGMDEAMDFARTDLWRLDPETETWSELPVTSDAEPPGRRLPFAALSDDGARLFVGYGSDHPGGLTVRKDLWAYELETGAWEKLTVEGDKPDGRGFALTLPGPDGAVGVMAFGVDEALTSYDDAWVLTYAP